MKYYTSLAAPYTQAAPGGQHQSQERKRAVRAAPSQEQYFWLTLLVASVCVALPVLAYRAVWGVNLFHSREWCSLWPLALFLMTIPAHEGVHGVGFLCFARVPWRTLRFGIQKWPHLNPYASCTAPLSMGAYRKTSLLPLIVLGVIPGVVALLCGQNLLAAWAMINCAAGAGDLANLWLTRSYPNDYVSRISER